MRAVHSCRPNWRQSSPRTPLRGALSPGDHLRFNMPSITGCKRSATIRSPIGSRCSPSSRCDGSLHDNETAAKHTDQVRYEISFAGAALSRQMLTRALLQASAGLRLFDPGRVQTQWDLTLCGQKVCVACKPPLAIGLPAQKGERIPRSVNSVVARRSGRYFDAISDERPVAEHF